MHWDKLVNLTSIGWLLFMHVFKWLDEDRVCPIVFIFTCSDEPADPFSANRLRLDHSDYSPTDETSQERHGKLSSTNLFCVHCWRSLRPSLDSIQTLADSHRSLHICTAEGRALAYLTERSLAWQQRAQCILSSRELLEMIRVLYCMSERTYESITTSRHSFTENILASGALKDAGAAEFVGQLKRLLFFALIYCCCRCITCLSCIHQ